MYNFIFIFYGLLAILTQLVIFRELSVLFYGNELFLGIFLSSWLFWTGLGNLSARRLLKKQQEAVKYFSFGFFILSLVLPLIILFIRLSKGLFSFGEFIGPLSTCFFTFAVMSVICFVIGGQFSLACRDNPLVKVYLYEALGSVIGGALFTYVLIGFVPLFIIVLILSLGCVFVGLKLLKITYKKTASLAVFCLTVLFVSFKIEPSVNSLQWEGYQFISQKETRNATLSLVKMGSIKSIFSDGILSASFPAQENYEAVAHWPLLAVAEPARVLVLGDFSLGTLKEVLKHNPEQVDFVVLDNSFLDFVKHSLGPDDISALNDTRVSIHYSDARLFVKNRADKYDVVIINMQEVANLKTNRICTQEFYSEVRKIIKPGGVLAVSLASSENYLSKQAKLFNSSVYQTLGSVFEAIEIIPGDSIIFLCSQSLIDTRKDIILSRFNARKISNSYLIPSYIGHKLDIERREEVKKVLLEACGIGINRDFRPTTYYYFSGFWLNKFDAPLTYIALIAMLAAAFIFGFKKKNLFLVFVKKREYVLIFILGFMGMLLELLLCLSFQIISGYVYWQMGILFAAFMFGLFLGAAVGARFKNTPPRKRFLILSALSLCIISFSLCSVYFLPHLINLSTVANIFIFSAALIFIGGVIGCAFVVAGLSTTVNLYTADLWGAALGALLSANFIVPVFGLLGALNVCALIGIFGLVMFILSK